MRVSDRAKHIEKQFDPSFDIEFAPVAVLVNRLSTDIFEN